MVVKAFNWASKVSARMGEIEGEVRDKQVRAKWIRASKGGNLAEEPMDAVGSAEAPEELEYTCEERILDESS